MQKDTSSEMRLSSPRSLVYNGLITYALFFRCAFSIASLILLLTPPVWRFFRDKGMLIGQAPKIVRAE